MTMRTRRVALVGVVASLLLVGCGGDPTPSGAGSTSAPDATGSPSAEPGELGARHLSGCRAKDRPADRQRVGPDGSGQSRSPARAPRPAPATTPTPPTAPHRAPAPALEMPEAPESTVSSLSELLAGDAPRRSSRRPSPTPRVRAAGC